MAGLLDFLQSASNAAASNISGPVDGLAWLLGKAGVPVREPMLGSAWMERQGLTRKVPQSAASLAGETLGLTAPIAAAAKAPQIAAGLLKAQEAAKPAIANMAETALSKQGLMPQAIAWHGSPREFVKFSLDAPKTTAGGLNKYGVSVSPSRQVGERYASDFSGGAGNLYKVDATTTKPLDLSAREFNKLQELTRQLDELPAGQFLPETKSVDLEMLLGKFGVKWKDGEHPIRAIRSAGFDSIRGAASAGGAEPEWLIFNPAAVRILERNGVPFK